MIIYTIASREAGTCAWAGLDVASIAPDQHDIEQGFTRIDSRTALEQRTGVLLTLRLAYAYSYIICSVRVLGAQVVLHPRDQLALVTTITTINILTVLYR
jgi:hypothetical protein